MLIRAQLTNLPEIIYKIILICKVIADNIIDPDDNFE